MAKEIELTPVEQQVQALRVQFGFHRRLSFFALGLAVMLGAADVASFLYEFLHSWSHPQLMLVVQVLAATLAVVSWEFSRFQWEKAANLFHQLYP